MGLRASHVLLALLLVLPGCGEGEDAKSAPKDSQEARFAGGEIQDPKPAPDFALTDQDGRRVSLSGERGRLVLVTFLYTNCPDVCPLIAENLNRALGQLGPARKDVRVLAVSVDPAGDTRAAVRRYVKLHRLRPEFRYLIGSRRTLTHVWRKYDVLAVARNPEQVDHTAYTLLVDREGRGRLVYPVDAVSTSFVHDLRLLLRS